VQRLQVQLFVAFDGHETHGRTPDGLGDGFGVNEVVFVSFHERLDVLGGNQTHLVPLFA
jgi:hypothetical protein